MGSVWFNFGSVLVQLWFSLVRVCLHFGFGSVVIQCWFNVVSDWFSVGSVCFSNVWRSAGSDLAQLLSVQGFSYGSKLDPVWVQFGLVLDHLCSILVQSGSLVVQL